MGDDVVSRQPNHGNQEDSLVLCQCCFNMLVIKTFLGIINFCFAAVATFFLALIIKYVQAKPPGHITVLDLLIVDSARIWIFFNTVINTLINCGLIYGHFGYFTAQVMLFLSNNVFTLLLASVQVTIVVKAILIFKGHWLEDWDDSTIQMISRFATVVYATIRFLVDYFTSDPHQAVLLGLLTNTDMKTSFGHGLGTGSLLAILITSLILLLIKKPHLPNEEDNALMKIFIGLGIAGISVGLIGIATSRWTTFDKSDVFHLTRALFSLIVDVLLPARFILSSPNLKQYVAKFIKQNLLINVFRRCFSSSRVDVSE